MIANVLQHPSPRTALFIAHPGHELRVYGWMLAARPVVYILTDGSGYSGVNRLHRTTELLSSLGAQAGSIFGTCSDQELYQTLLRGDASRFTDLVDNLAGAWTEEHIEVVVSDAHEGSRLAHDICNELAKAAVEIVRGRSGRNLEHFSFTLEEWEPGGEKPRTAPALHIQLSDECLQQKIAAARSYSELREEVDYALALKGHEYFRLETLFNESEWACTEAGYKPGYETTGEQLVAQGKYAQVLRYCEHVAPLFQALRLHAEQQRPA